MTTDNNAFWRLLKILTDEHGIEKSKITEDSKFMDDLGLDSLDLVELLMRIEEEFNHEIPDDQAELFITVGDVVRYVEERELGDHDRG